MIINRAGAITPELHVLGSIDLPAFFLKTERPALIDAGMTLMGERYIQEIQKMTDGRGPEYFFLTHTHYDHCGAVPILKNAFPEMQICCSETGEQVLQRPRAIQTIRELNRSAVEYFKELGEDVPDSSDFEPFSVDRALADGETVRLGADLSLKAISTPGHTRDAMCFYVPEKKMLFTGEAVGIMEADGYIFSEWLSDYNDYFYSMKKLEDLEVDILCLGHGHVLTGSDAAGYIPRSVEYCIYFRKLIETTLQETGNDVEAAKRRIKETEYDTLPGTKQPDFAYLLNLDAKIRAVQRLKSEQAEE